jgi:hypothetical protein
MNDILKEFWALIMLAASTLVYVIRAEGKQDFHEKEILRLQHQRDMDQQAAMRSREETHHMLRDMDIKLDRLIERNMK